MGYSRDSRKSKPLHVVIVGGGYAGLAALVTLHEQCSRTLITLIDSGDEHVKVTHLHESFSSPQKNFRIPFCLLEKRFGIRHIKASLLFSEADLSRYSESGQLEINGEKISFDYLLWSTGSGLRTNGLEKGENTLILDDFSKVSGPSLLQTQLSRCKEDHPCITVVGGGASGVQFLFEIDHYIRVNKLPWTLRLVDSGNKPLRQFVPSLGRYVCARMEDLGIEYIPNHYFLIQRNNSVVLEDRDSYSRCELPSALTLYFSGKNDISRIETNWFGQIRIGGKTLKRIFAAGDCAHYRSPGSNTLTAQSAVRKGILAARNIMRQAGFLGLMWPYMHRDLGYVVSMGPSDAIGWVGSPKNIIAGSPALSVKAVVESQYDLLLAGTDTFVL